MIRNNNKKHREKIKPCHNQEKQNSGEIRIAKNWTNSGNDSATQQNVEKIEKNYFLTEKLRAIVLQWRSVKMNSLGPAKFVRYNQEFFINGWFMYHTWIWDRKKNIFLWLGVCYSRKFVVTEFDCNNNLSISSICWCEKLTDIWAATSFMKIGLTFWSFSNEGAKSECQRASSNAPKPATC